ncbi:mandelate racemase/muconate lactonizing enzyme family protein [Salinirubellus sp. GCM10025818]|uniref:mandelate racemase/muconate lactonizing enzyme family protein n=1 Tax=Salinirubellus TaxID=2162630 RepID=UPI0030D393AA
MRITDVETHLLEVPREVEAADSRHVFDRWYVTAIEVGTDEGHTGLGWMASTRAGAVFEHLLDDQFVPLLADRSPFETEAIRRDLRDHAVYYGETGMSAYPRAVIDIALWDLKAKAADVPLYRLLGGEDGRVKAYASSLDAGLSLDELRERHGRRADEGFTAFKTKVGTRRPSEEAERVAAVREAVGPGAEVFVDANQAWTVKETVEVVGAIDEHGVDWVEEPISEWNLDGHARIASRIDPPLATGEMFYRPERFRWLAERDGLDVAQPDLIRAGGVSGVLDVARVAADHHVPLCPHANHAVSAHLVSAAPTGRLVEYFTGGDLAAAILEEPPAVEDGHVHLPDRPGHGYHLDPEAVEAFASETV